MPKKWWSIQIDNSFKKQTYQHTMQQHKSFNLPEKTIKSDITVTGNDGQKKSQKRTQWFVWIWIGESSLFCSQKANEYDYIQQLIEEQNPSKQQLDKLQNLLENNKDHFIDPETCEVNEKWQKIKHSIRNKMVFEIVLTIFNYYPVSRFIFEDRTKYFGAEYKNGLLANIPNS